MPAFRKSDDPVLDIQTAGDILNEIFEETGVNPNSVSLEVLDSYSCYRKERFALQRIVILLIMILFMLLPLLFLAPSMTIDETNEKDAIFPSYEIQVHAMMPISSVTATIDGQNIPVAERDLHSYVIRPSINGKMQVNVTLLNRQRVSRYISVESIDNVAPVMLSNRSDSDCIYLYLSDDDSGINYDSIKGVKADGTSILPLSYNASEGLVTFASPTESMEVYVSDYAGNTLKLMLSVK